MVRHISGSQMILKKRLASHNSGANKHLSSTLGRPAPTRNQSCIANYSKSISCCVTLFIIKMLRWLLARGAQLKRHVYGKPIADIFDYAFFRIAWNALRCRHATVYLRHIGHLAGSNGDSACGDLSRRGISELADCCRLRFLLSHD